MKREELLSLDKEALVDIIEALISEVSKLRLEIEGLKAQINQNSTNSSKPPSSDWKAAKIPREKTVQGGQFGHKGNFLRIEQASDETVELKVSKCKKCGESLYANDTMARRKVDDPYKSDSIRAIRNSLYVLRQWKQGRVSCWCKISHIVWRRSTVNRRTLDELRKC